MSVKNNNLDPGQPRASARLGFLAVMGLLLWATSGTMANAHTLPYFDWFQVERQIIANTSELRVIHTCRFDPQTFRADDPLVDSDGNSTASQRELADICALTARYLAEDFLVVIADRPVPANLQSFAMIEESTGFRTEMMIPLSGFHGVIPVILLDPAYLFPRLPTVSDDVTSSRSVIKAEGDGVSLQDDTGTLVRTIESEPLFRTDLGLDLRPPVEPECPPTSATSSLAPLQINHAPTEEAS